MFEHQDVNGGVPWGHFAGNAFFYFVLARFCANCVDNFWDFFWELCDAFCLAPAKDLAF